MTTVRQAVRKHRARTLLAVLAVVAIGAGTAVVVPALAGVGDAAPPASDPGGITPTEINNGGQNNDCAFVGSAALISWRITSPATGTYTQVFNNRTVT